MPPPPPPPSVGRPPVRRPVSVRPHTTPCSAQLPDIVVQFALQRRAAGRYGRVVRRAHVQLVKVLRTHDHTVSAAAPHSSRPTHTPHPTAARLLLPTHTATLGSCRKFTNQQVLTAPKQDANKTTTPKIFTE